MPSFQDVGRGVDNILDWIVSQTPQGQKLLQQAKQPNNAMQDFGQTQNLGGIPSEAQQNINQALSLAEIMANEVATSSYKKKMGEMFNAQPTEVLAGLVNNIPNQEQTQLGQGGQQSALPESATPGVGIRKPPHFWTQAGITQGPNGQIIQQGGPLDISGERVKDAMGIAEQSQKLQGKEPMQQGKKEEGAMTAAYAAPSEATGAINALANNYDTLWKALPSPLKAIGFKTKQMQILEKNMNILSQRPEYAIQQKQKLINQTIGSPRMKQMIAEARKRGLM